MIKTKKVFLVIFLILIVSLMLIPTNVHAALQSNGDSAAKKSIDGWMLSIRKMQSPGGALGLNDTINTTDLSSNNKNVDIHMEKNTEYGGFAILSASQYGNPNKITDGGTTTGNVSGIVMKINYEWVAAGGGLQATTYAQKAKARYINNDYDIKNGYYSGLGSKYHVGDAMDIGGWHGSGETTWINYAAWAGFLRAASGSIFSYSGYIGNYGNGHGGSNGYPANYDKQWASRAIMVLGTGI